jgi:hypothetical protein
MEIWQIAGAIVLIVAVFVIAGYLEYRERKKTVTV